MKTLIVNTYAGSLLLGAKAAGADIIGSYEDAGFGSAMPKANFPGLHLVDHIADWPDDTDLTDAVVLAHPPCAAFSQQNNSPAKKGVDTEAFDCTRKVLRYAMGHNAAGIAVESVMGALGGGWDVHQHFADKYGYFVYRVVKNSLLMGVPQYRERFWAVFVRKGAADPIMTWRLVPRIRSIAEVLEPVLPGTPVMANGTQTLYDKVVRRFVNRLVNEAGLTEAQALDALNPPLQWRRTSYARVLQARHFPTLRHQQVCKSYIANFASSQPSFLAPGGYAPVLLGSSLWLYKGQVIPEEGYKVIMGFPANYIFPEKHRHEIRKYLSKGVCPPVAEWIWCNLVQHLNASGWQHSYLTSTATLGGAYVKQCEPNRVVSFRVGKTSLFSALESRYHGTHSSDLIPLRNEEDDLESDD